MINLEDLNRLRPGRLTIGKRVKAGAEDQVLSDTACHGRAKAILGIAAADQEAGAPLWGERMAKYGSQPLFVEPCDIDERWRDRVDEDLRLIVARLMHRPHNRGNVARPASLGPVHARHPN